MEMGYWSVDKIKKIF